MPCTRKRCAPRRPEIVDRGAPHADAHGGARSCLLRRRETGLLHPRRTERDGDGPRLAADRAADGRPRGPAPEPTPAGSAACLLRHSSGSCSTVMRDRARADSIAKAERKASEGRQAEGALPDGQRAGHRTLRLAHRPCDAADDDDPPPGAKQTKVPSTSRRAAMRKNWSCARRSGDAQGGGRVALHVAAHRRRALAARRADGHRARAPADVAALGWNDAAAPRWCSQRRATTRRAYSTPSTADSGRSRRSTSCATARGLAARAIGCAGWLAGRRESGSSREADGYAHLYTANADGGDRKQLTKGKWEVAERRSCRPTASRSTCTRAKARPSSSTSTDAGRKAARAAKLTSARGRTHRDAVARRIA